MKPSLVSAPGFRFLLGLGLILATSLRAEEPDPNVPLTPQQVEQLLGPIALYPDALVAIILPAATAPTDIVLAQRYLSNGGDPDKIEYEPWNDSVKALARYPMLIGWLDENLTWTRQLGNTFLNQPEEVISSVQRLRARARANGSLTSTPQQKLLLDGDDIQIVPAQPDVIYVPYYDPSLVYGPPGYYSRPPYVTFGLGLPIGFWLSYDFNWRTRVIIVGDRHHNWSEHRDWDHRGGYGDKPYNGNWRPWSAPAGRSPHSHPDSHRQYSDVPRPRPVPGPTSYPPHDQYPGRPQPDNNYSGNPHNRPPSSPNNPGWNQDHRDHRPPSTPAPQPQDNNSPPSNPPPPEPANNPSWNQDNRGRHPSTPTPRPDNGPPPSANPPRSTPPTQNSPPPMPDRQPSSRPPEVRPVNQPPPPSPPPRPAPSTPPPPKDNPRDNLPEPPR